MISLVKLMLKICVKRQVKNYMQYTESQFGCCPLVQGSHGNRTLDDTMNKIQERALYIVQNDHHYIYDQSLEKDCSYSIHQRNLQRLVIKIYKFKTNLGPEIVNDIFEASSNTRSDKTLKTRMAKSVFNGTETVSFRAQKTWDIVPDDIKRASSLNEFKLKIKKWKPCNCTCRLCKTFVDGVGFVDNIEQA